MREVAPYYNRDAHTQDQYIGDQAFHDNQCSLSTAPATANIRGQRHTAWGLGLALCPLHYYAPPACTERFDFLGVGSQT